MWSADLKHIPMNCSPKKLILLWLIYLAWSYNLIPTLFEITPEYIVLTIMIVIGYLLNSKVKIPHP